MMKPLGRRGLPVAKRVFNYRLSRVRRIVENGFGILANRWGCLLTTLQQHLSTIEDIILCCICLHNLMCLRHPVLQNAAVDGEDGEGNFVPGEWRTGPQMQGVTNVYAGNLATRVGKQQ